MVFIITGAATSDRNTVSRLLAEALGWEFVDAESLRPSTVDTPRSGTVLANADPTLRVETLSAAIAFWLYEWRDAVVSCPLLAENDRTRLSKMSSLVKIVCLEASHASRRTPVLDRSVPLVSSEFPARRRTACNPGQDVLTVDSSRQIAEIISEITSALIT